MAHILSAAITGDPTSPAIILPFKPTAQTISYAQLGATIAALQRTLAHHLGVTRGSSPVSIALPNSPELVVAFLAVAAQGAAAAPLNPAYRQGEFEFYIGDVGSTVVLVPRGSVAEKGKQEKTAAPVVEAARRFGCAVVEVWWDPSRLEVGVDVKEWGKLGESRVEANTKRAQVGEARADDVALVLHTSGTTSRPKVVPLTHRNLTQTMSNIRATYQLTPADRTMLVMPLFHVHGILAGLLAPLGSGGSLVLPPRFSATDFWPDFIAHQANWYTAVPTMHQILLRHPVPDPLPNIRFIRSCSSPLSPAAHAALEAAFGAPVLEAYAMTEAAHQMTSNPLPPAKRKPGTVGLGQGVEVRILDDAGRELPPGGGEGEICARGDNITSGYLNNEAANNASYTPDRFFRTGDQGRLDEDGYVVITGRIKELINKGGEKVSPIELDNIISRHPVVSEVVSFAVEDELYGQDIGVAIVLESGESLDEDQVKRWVEERAAKFKVPKKVFFTETMPKTATGKIQRRIVAETMLKQEQQQQKKNSAPKAKL